MVTIGNSEGVGIPKAKIFRGKYEAKLEFPEGQGRSNQKPSMGVGEWIFFGTIQHNTM